MLLTAGLTGTINTAHAATYPGNGGTGFGGNVGNGMLTVNNDGSGGILFSFALANSSTSFNATGNDLVLYIDNGKGGGIGNTTSVLTDTADSSRQPVSEYNGTSRSTLTFASLMSPQYAIDLSTGQANIFNLSTSTSNFGYAGGSNIGSTTTTGGVKYSLSGSTYSIDVPAADLGLVAFKASTLKFLAINISNTGYSSDESTVKLTGSLGYNNTQAIQAVNSFTTVPEPGTWAMLATGLGALLGIQRIRRQSAR